MKLGLAGKKFIVTGASRGIGAATARILAAEGARLVLVGRNSQALERVRDDIAARYGAEPVIEICDLGLSGAAAALAARHHDVDMLVNNAGAVPGGSLFDVSEPRWREGWDGKVYGYIAMCRAFYPVIAARAAARRQAGDPTAGVIVNVLGNGSRMKRFDYLCGGMANAALDFLTETLGAGSPQDGIRVVGISPGPVDTERYRGLAKARADASGELREHPFGRVPTPDEIAALIAMLASDRCGYVSGAILMVDGGMSVSREPAAGRDFGNMQNIRKQWEEQT